MRLLLTLLNAEQFFKTRYSNMGLMIIDMRNGLIKITFAVGGGNCLLAQSDWMILTLWLCSGQIDPKNILFFPKILVNVIALDSNLLTLCT